MIYTSTEGEEPVVSGLFSVARFAPTASGSPASRRVADTFQKIAFDPARKSADLMGSLNAGWADMGLHPETFWLGYATAAAAAWNPGSPDPAESDAAFYPLFYGPSCRADGSAVPTHELRRPNSGPTVGKRLCRTRASRSGETRTGSSKNRIRRTIRTFPCHRCRRADLSYHAEWTSQNSRRLQLAADFLAENDELLGLLHDNLPRSELNSYNLEVFLLYRAALPSKSGDVAERRSHGRVVAFGR